MGAPIMLRRARQMRREPTDAERTFWSLVRGRRFAGFKFRRQIWIGAFIADFVCEHPKLIVEIDGGQHATQIPYDLARTRCLQARGYRVVRFWSNDVLARTEAVQESLLRALQTK